MKSICLVQVSLSTTGTATTPFPVPAAAPSWVCGGPAPPPSPHPGPAPGTGTRGRADPPPSSSDRVPASNWGRLISPGQEKMHTGQRRKKDGGKEEDVGRQIRQQETACLSSTNKTSTFLSQRPAGNILTPLISNIYTFTTSHHTSALETDKPQSLRPDLH